MRTDTAAVAGIRDHQIVEPRIGHEAKAVEQRAGAVVVQIDTLYEQRPRALFDGRQFVRCEGTVLQLPPVAEVCDEARFDFVPIVAFEVFVARGRRRDSWNSLTPL